MEANANTPLKHNSKNGQDYRGTYSQYIRHSIVPWCLRAIIVSMWMVLSACTTQGSSTIKTNKTNTPQPSVYPNAEILSLDRSMEGRRTITFRTADNPEDVLRFYDDRLVRDGWKKGNTLPGYQGYRYEERDTYAFEVIIDRIDGGFTYGRLQFTFVGPGHVFPTNYPFPPEFRE